MRACVTNEGLRRGRLPRCAMMRAMHMIHTTRLRVRRMALLAASLALLAGCAGVPRLTDLAAPKLKPGQDEAAAVAQLGQPTNRYAMPGGRTRLEFAKGPLGHETWMVDLDAAGRISAVEQVLNPRRFAEVRNGMTAQELTLLLGRPGRVQREYQDRQTWYWRFPTYDCMIFAVTLSPLGRVIQGGAQMPDPACDVSQ